MTENYTIRPFSATDLDQMLVLLPQLADFNVPERRDPDDLWSSDAELLSHAPSAHLEAIVVAPEACGQGLGQMLLNQAERAAGARGADSLSLHVFSNNLRARGLYDRQGYDSELIRAIKWLK